MTSPVLVVGATGTTGSRVGAFLKSRGVPTRLASRRPNSSGYVEFDWADRRTHGPALSGVAAVYLVAPVGEANPLPLVEPFLEEALRHGVHRVVQLSSSAVPKGSPGLGEVHALISATMPEWTVLRPSWFMQNFSGDHPVAEGVRNGEIVTGTGDGKIAFIDARDIAAVAGFALTDSQAHNTEHIITGPEALSYSEAAAIITQQTGVPITHRAIPAAELTERFIEHGVPQDFAEFLTALDADISNGSEDRVTTTVSEIIGRPARNFRDFAQDSFP